jgi:phytoene dehydrogenase-like protein
VSTIAVIGSGLGGLIAGNLLAKKGHRVTVFESHQTPGGYTAGFTRRGYYFESGTLSFEFSNTVFKVMRDIGVFDRIDFVRQPMRFVGRRVDFTGDTYEGFKGTFFNGYPDEEEHLQRYFSAVGKMYRAMRPFLQVQESGVKRLLSYAGGGLRMLTLSRKYSNINLSRFTEHYFEKGTALYNIFKSFGYPEMSAFSLGGAVATILHDYWTVRSGMQHWADVLADSFREAGGELRLNAYVEEIRTRNSTAIGVVSDGTLYEADYVISAGDYKKTFLRLLDDQSLIPDEMLGRIQNARVSEGFFTVYLGLSMPNDKLRAFMKVPHVGLFDERGEADLGDPDDERYFEKTTCTLYSPSLLNSALAPEGKSSLMLQVIAPKGWMNDWGGGDRGVYRTLKDQATDAVVENASSLIPDLRKYIEFEDAATPLTYERYTHNTEGATSAWSWNPERKFYSRMYGTNITTPVRNLLIGSCWASQLGGVPGAVGAAVRCVKKIV